MILTKNSENKIKFLILLFIFLFSISISNVISRNYYSDNSSYGQETQYQKFFRVVKKLYVPEDNKNYNCEIIILQASVNSDKIVFHNSSSE